MNSFSALDSLFDPANPSFTEKGVQTLLELRSSEAEAARLEELAEKANEGQLSPGEQREYEDQVRAGTFISLLQAKARLYRKRLAAGA
jgi:hypothetical protein